ncbi:MAG TPA: hypothetical protein VGR14_21105 [Verrucomicrobiae bacterium]|nr:hypothetical protein [Verrucomicrobiae bacterium]
MQEETKPAADPAADLALAACLSFKDRRKQWFAAFDKLLWDDYNALDSVETACRDAKALGFSRSTIMKDSGKDGGTSLLGFIVGKYQPVCASLSEALKEVYRIADEVGLPDRVLMFTQEVPDLYYEHHRHTFWYKTDGGCYQNITKETALEMLNEAGLSVKKEENGMPSEAHRLLLEVIRTKGIDWTGALAGYPVGVHQVKGINLLVTRSFTLIQPDPEDKTEAPHIMALAHGLYGDKAIHLHLWRKEAYESLMRGLRNTNMAFICVGPTDSGKSLDLDYVTVPLLGGRKANAYSYLSRKTDFNDEQIGSEVHVIDDGNPFETPDARKQFANSIKQEVASNEAWCHPKGKAGFTLPLFRRLCILANPDDIALMPELDQSMEDKLIMLEAKPCVMPPGCLPLPARNDIGAREAFVAQLRKELPAYINWLRLLEPATKDFESRRWGVAAFKDENLVRQLDELSSTKEKHAVIQKTIFRSHDYRASNAAEIEINDLYELLCEGQHKDRAAKLFRNVRALGSALGHLSRKKEGYDRRESHGESLWHIERDAKFDKAANVEPE